ncbi:MAG TPA: hypothetical protein DCP68_04485 [Ruminococcus sp.]|nr:hypothetical protein [Ruminococcus sp.]
MTDTKENIMGTLPIGRLLMKMSVPVILSMLVSTLYGVIDSIFVSRLGDNALTAMSLATPISSLIACITSAMILSKIGTVNTVWFAFVITEVLVTMLAVILMRTVNNKTISRIPSNIVKTYPAAEM